LPDGLRARTIFGFEIFKILYYTANMDEFSVREHARLVGNVLIGLALFAFGIALAGFLPDEVFALPPHYFGNGGAAAIGALFLIGGFWLRSGK
jgi:hypothetical protein